MNTLFPLLALLLTGCNSGDDNKKAEADPCAPAATDADRLPEVRIPSDCPDHVSAYELVTNDGTGSIILEDNYELPSTITYPGFYLTWSAPEDVVTTPTILPDIDDSGESVSPLVDLIEGGMAFMGINFDGLSLSEGIRFKDAELIIEDAKISDVTSGITPSEGDTVSTISLANIQFDDVEGESALRMNSGFLEIGNLAVTESESDEGVSLIQVGQDADVTVTGGIGLRDNTSNSAPLLDLATQSDINSLVMHDNESKSAPLANLTVGVQGQYGDSANAIIFDNIYDNTADTTDVDSAINLYGYGNLRLDHWLVDGLVNTNTSSCLIGLYPQTGGSVVVKNSIFANNWYTTGALFCGLTEDDYAEGAAVYNDGYNNENEADLVALSPTNVNVDPNFTSSTVYPDCKAYDYLLASGSALIDAGNPSDRDADGSVTDIGAFGGEGQAVLENFLTWYCGL